MLALALCLLGEGPELSTRTSVQEAGRSTTLTCFHSGCIRKAPGGGLRTHSIHFLFATKCPTVGKVPDT
jgi:hypothetical protein